jgi:hypothetical protein
VPTAKPPTTDDLPLYIRWSPDKSDYAIELRLDLVPKISSQISLSKELGTEVGGLLIGALTRSPVPTIRIESIEVVSSGSHDDTVFLPEPSRFRSFAEARDRRERELGVIGFFRTHARLGLMRPSLADRSIFGQELQETPYVVLLIQAQSPHTAAFFIAEKGQLPEHPSVREFEFDENAFKALPEVPPELSAKQVVEKQREPPLRRIGLYARMAALIAIAVGACALMWNFAHQPSLPGWFSSGPQLHLSIAPEGNLLRVSWNHSASELNQATGATLIIDEGARHAELSLGVDDLRLGSIEYQGSGGEVSARMVLNTPKGQTRGDSAKWRRK